MAELKQTIEPRELVLVEGERAGAFRRLVRMLLPFLGLLLVLGPFSFLDYFTSRAEGFLTTENFMTAILQTFIVAVAGVGMTFVIISGGIDLSVGSMVALSTVATAMVLMGPGARMLEPPAGTIWASIASRNALILPIAAGALALLAGVGASLVAGFLNGAMITGLRIVPFIATLGMWGIARGVAKLLANEQGVYPAETWLNFLSRPERSFWPSLAIVLVIVILMAFLLNYTRFGRYTIALGSNEATARLCGVPVNKVRLGIYSLAGLLTGIAGVLQYSRLTMGDPTVAQGLELDVIAAVVIGGGSLSGGEGSIVGTLVGALAMSFLRVGCTLMGWPNYVQEIFIGVFIVIFVAIDQLRRAHRA
jgi:ribose/xylose/arabinose/galactoside ABC-type transport system permease subunit